MRLLVFILLAIIFSLPAYAQNPYKDIPKGHWAENLAILMYKENIMLGINENEFGGEQPLTRYKLASILDHLLGNKSIPIRIIVFSDIPPTNPDYKSVVKVISANLMTYNPEDGTFNGTKGVTRYEFAEALDKLLTLLVEYTPKRRNPPISFKDVSPQYKTLVDRTTNLWQLTNGYSDGTFRGNRVIIRYEALAMVAQAAALLYPNIKSVLASLPSPQPTATPILEIPVQPTPEIKLTPEPTVEPTPDLRLTPEPTITPKPTLKPTFPTAKPTVKPTVKPTPTPKPTPKPTLKPTLKPTPKPTPDLRLTPEPTTPTIKPTPTLTITPEPTVEPTPDLRLTPEPTLTPTPIPTLEPTSTPTVESTPQPSIEPTPQIVDVVSKPIPILTSNVQLSGIYYLFMDESYPATLKSYQSIPNPNIPTPTGPTIPSYPSLPISTGTLVQELDANTKTSSMPTVFFNFLYFIENLGLGLEIQSLGGNSYSDYLNSIESTFLELLNANIFIVYRVFNNDFLDIVIGPDGYFRMVQSSYDPGNSYWRANKNYYAGGLKTILGWKINNNFLIDFNIGSHYVYQDLITTQYSLDRFDISLALNTKILFWNFYFNLGYIGNILFGGGGIQNNHGVKVGIGYNF